MFRKKLHSGLGVSTFLILIPLAGANATTVGAAMSEGSECLESSVEINPGFGCFFYYDDGDNAGRPVRVFYYRPDNYPSSDSKVVFTMHGSGRNAQSARDRIVPYADRYDALLVAPEFSREHYPDADDYNRGFVKDGGGDGNLRNRDDWTLLTIEELFDVVHEQIPGAPDRYSILGNSGAGQFISRLPILVPEARFEVAAGSNSGWYTLPVRDELYPNGIGDLDISDEQIESMYGRKNVVVVGELDTDPNSYQLKHTEFTDAQGNNRYERAQFYYDYMRTDAANRGVPFNWDLIIVEDVGHPAELMAHATAGAVFEGVTTPADVTLLPLEDTYVDESEEASNFGSLLELQVDGGNQETAYLKFDLSNVNEPARVAMLKLFISNGSDGKQYVHEVSDNSWDESALTWNNAPALGRQVGMTTGGEKDGILYVAITDYVNEKIGGHASLAFESVDTDQLFFNSREASDNQAQLLLFAEEEIPVVTLSASDATASEAGADAGLVTVARTGSTEGDLAVTFAVSGTATEGADYELVGTSVTVPAGSATATITLTPVDDSTVEGSEEVIVTLSAEVGYDVGTPSTATVVIADDDGAPGPPRNLRIGSPANP